MEILGINSIALSYIEEIRKKSERIKPLVVISCLTYNHQEYLREALDGFVMQQTDFPFVAVVHDDASTDSTATILREYVKKYPNIILPIYEAENQHSKPDVSLSRIMSEAQDATGARYVALCEGDDYWTDPLKLQKQVDFLESRPDYSMCFHNALVHYEDGRKPDHLFAKLQTRDYDISENIVNWIIPTASVVCRRTIYDSPYYEAFLASKRIMVGDYSLIQSCAKEGKIYGFSETMSVYRLQPTGWTQTVAKSNRIFLKLIYQELEYRRIFGGYHYFNTPKAIAKHSRGALSLLKYGYFAEAFKLWSVALRYAPWQTIVANVKFVFKSGQRRNQ